MDCKIQSVFPYFLINVDLRLDLFLNGGSQFLMTIPIQYLLDTKKTPLYKSYPDFFSCIPTLKILLKAAHFSHYTGIAPKPFHFKWDAPYIITFSYSSFNTKVTLYRTSILYNVQFSRK